jgi:Fur family ferric uptake transcriptional regulator
MPKASPSANTSPRSRDHSQDDPWRHQLAAAGMRWTHGVHAALHVLEEAAAPMDHEAVLQALAREGESVNRVTVYRLLDRLVAVGLAEKVVGADRISRFVLRREGHDPQAVQPFFECTACHRLQPLEAPRRMPKAFGDLLLQLNSEGYLAENLRLTVSGECADCRKH